MAANPAINLATPYDPIKDFTPIINLAATPIIIAVHPSFPARDFAGFLKETREIRTSTPHASSGTGGIQHMLMEVFKSLAGLKMIHVPYTGTGPALNDTSAGQVHMILDNLPSALNFIRAGKLVPIVVAAHERVKALPDTPTFKEIGFEPVNRMAGKGAPVRMPSTRSLLRRS